jgi:hypothetical protein
MGSLTDNIPAQGGHKDGPFGIFKQKPELSKFQIAF